jgi:hypothetical protein
LKLCRDTVVRNLRIVAPSVIPSTESLCLGPRSWKWARQGTRTSFIAALANMVHSTLLLTSDAAVVAIDFVLHAETNH